MHLKAALGITTAAELDPDRPLRVGSFELGIDVAALAYRIIEGTDPPRHVTYCLRDFSSPLYWFVSHADKGDAEIFGFPASYVGPLPTAIENALVWALAFTPPDAHSAILNGGAEVIIGSQPACEKFRNIIGVKPPLEGESLLFSICREATIRKEFENFITNSITSCLNSSFLASPLKFRFVEIYRVIEARFLADVKRRLFSNFDAEPSPALSEALESLKSEMNQLVSLSENCPEYFEDCWTALDAIRGTNRFAAALFRRIEKRNLHTSGKCKSGAALIYQMRCAIVHAGERDLVFEKFPDGVAAIEAVIPHVERAALAMIGVDVR